MKLAEFKEQLKSKSHISFKLPDGRLVPKHFHVTEIGNVVRHFIDCGGTERKEHRVNFQLWSAADYDHRLHPEKLVQIIELAEEKLNLGNHEIDVEYQGETINTFSLTVDGDSFKLASKTTDCLAKDACGIPEEKPRVRLSDIQNGKAVCTPDSGCC